MITGSMSYNRWVAAKNAGSLDLTVRNENVSLANALLIPGLTDPVTEIKNLLFAQGQQGLFVAPTLSPTMITGNTFGSGVTDLLDLSGRGNTASQATPSSRAAWFREPKTGRRNLLTRSNQFNLSPWTVLGAGAGVNPVITPNAATDPLGGNNAFRIDFNRGADTISDRSEVSQTLSAALTGQNVLSVWVKAATSGDVGKDIAIRHVGSAAYGSVTLTADWVRVSRVETAAGSANNITFGSRGTFNTSTTVSVLVYQMQLESGATPTAIQNVTTAFDVTESGQRDCYGVWADGADDNYVTNAIDFSTTPRVTVFAAVRKLSDAAAGMIVELGPSYNTTDGSFGLAGPSSAAPTYSWNSRGTALAFVGPSGFASPVTNILTGIADISTPVCTLRANGVQVATTANTQGTGNYRNDVLRIFRRGGTTLPFNGQLYALIVAGGSYSLSTIQRVERLLSRITPTVNL
jgi:hypothetical protein